MKTYEKPTTYTVAVCEKYALMSTSNPTTSILDPDPDHHANGNEAMTQRQDSYGDYWLD